MKITIPKEIKAVIFDMDGLLIDSEPSWNEGDAQFLKEKGIPLPPDIITLTLGLGQKEALAVFRERLGLTGDDEVLTRQRKGFFYTELFKDLRLMEGAEALVKNFFVKGYKLAIASGGHTVEKQKEILKLLFLDKYFSVFVSSDNVERGKPFPDLFLKTARDLSVHSSECLVLEDAPNGIKAAKAAGMMVYGVNADENLRQDLEKVNPDKVLSSLLEINV